MLAFRGMPQRRPAARSYARSKFVPFVTLLGVVLLSGCAPVGRFLDPGPRSTGSRGPVQHSAAISKPSRTVDERRESIVANAVRPVPRPQQGPMRPVALTGMDPQSVSRLFGKPRSVQKTNESLVWGYERQSCTLRVVFYPDIDTKELHVLQYAVKNSRRRQPADATTCIRALRTSSQ
jgi:hypothetical protein